jgi:hypothetical protein
MDFIQKKEQEEKNVIEAKMDESNIKPKKEIAATEPEKNNNVLTNTLRTIVEPIASIISKPENVKEEVKEEPKDKIVTNLKSEPEFFISNDDAENINIYSKTEYIFNNDTYYYLDSEDNSNTLQKNIQTLISKEEVTYRVKICLFKIIDECKEPFLQFLLEKTNDSMVFPSFETSSNELNNGDANNIFITKCAKYMNEMSNNSRTSSRFDIINRCFRGFIEEPEHIIYAIFDCTYLDIDVNAQRFWGILDEIVNEKYIYKTPIDKDIYTMIQNNEFLAYIKDKNGERINMPCCLYLCKVNDNGEYDNIYYETDQHNMKHKSPVDGKISHEVFGHFYYFTTDPIHNDNNVNRLKRFSVFIDNALYVLNINKPIEEIDFITDDEDDFDETYKSYRDYTCIYFFEDGLQLWCVKSLSRFIEL